MAKLEREGQLPVRPDATKALAEDAKRVLEQARVEMEKTLQQDMQKVGDLVAVRMEAVQRQLSLMRAEIEGLQAQTVALKSDPVNDLLRQARERLQGV